MGSFKLFVQLPTYVSHNASFPWHKVKRNMPFLGCSHPSRGTGSSAPCTSPSSAILAQESDRNHGYYDLVTLEVKTMNYVDVHL